MRAHLVHMSTNNCIRWMDPGASPEHPQAEQLRPAGLPPTRIRCKESTRVFSIDNASIRLFGGASKVARRCDGARYGPRFPDTQPVVCAGGCAPDQTTPFVELHGFLSYLISAISRKKPIRSLLVLHYQQVRDNIQLAHVVLFMR